MKRFVAVLFILVMSVVFATSVAAVDKDMFRFKVEFEDTGDVDEFEYVRIDADGNQVSGTEYLDESGIVECGASERIVFTNLDPGTRYMVSELKDGKYVQVYSSDVGGMIEAGKTANVQFVNQESTARMPETGGDGVVAIVVVGVLVMGFGFLVAFRRKHA